jgi:60 kDa SS-A/Ro ribonucleoprotein
MTRYAPHISKKVTPQTEQADPRQVLNNQGGFSFQVDDWKRLERWLILGAEGGSYYASERKLTRENATVIDRCLKADGVRTVKTIVEVSDTGRAPKNDPAIFALAIAAASDEASTRRAALAALPKVCRTGTHLFQFAETVNQLRGWGRALRTGVADWYTTKTSDQVAHQIVKYQQRNGWSHRDLLRLAHPTAPTPAHQAAFRFAVAPDKMNEARHLGKENKRSYERTMDVPSLLVAYEQMKAAKSEKEVVRLIREHGLTHEMVTNDWKGSKAVWEALVESMPLMATVRNLGKMSSIGLLSPLSDASKTVVNRLRNEHVISQSRIHPINVLTALRTYQSGRGVKGSLTWSPDQAVLAALEEAFYTSFAAIEPTNKRIMVCLDVSASMTWSHIPGCPGINPRVGSAVMSMATVRTEHHNHIMGFSDKLVPISFNARTKLDNVVAAIERIPMGGTDCSLPMQYAEKNNIPVDAFYVYTDSETAHGRIHPHQALKSYRQKTGIPAKLIVVGMLANEFTIADPSDAGMLDVVGFDSAAPAVMADFTR